MGPCKFFFTALFITMLTTVYSQHTHGERTPTTMPLMKFDLVLSQALSDPELANYKMESVVMTLAPGAVDTVSHRHDCELFGYVLEGKVQVGLMKQEATTFASGQMFYEERNILHTLTTNLDKKKAAKILLIFIIKNGRTGYTAAYPNEK